jgi:hypothetical protein
VAGVLAEGRYEVDHVLEATGSPDRGRGGRQLARIVEEQWQQA